MSEDLRPHRRIINDRNDVFATSICFKGKLWSKMREARIVTEIVEENIKYGKTPYEQKRELLDYLATRPKSDYNKFIQCLADDNQRDAAKEFALPGFEPKPPQPEPSFGRSTQGQSAPYGIQQTPAEASGSIDAPDSLMDTTLVDGPIDVNVQMSSHRFYKDHKEKAYRMDRNPRGPALIVNVKKIKDRKTRDGTDVDRDNLIKLWDQLHFRTKALNDEDGLEAEEIKQHIKTFVDGVQAEDQACILCLLSHGNNFSILGTDNNEVLIDDIKKTFDENKHLEGKPKIIIIQSCRGRSIDLYETDAVSYRANSNDFIVGYATKFDYEALRAEGGSVYIRAIVQVFMNHARNKDIPSMLREVNRLVSAKKIDRVDGKHVKQSTEHHDQLRMDLYFFPGYIA